MSALDSRHSSLGHRLLLIGELVLCGVLWGLAFSLAKIAGEGEHHSLGLAFWTGLGGGLMLLALAALRRRPPPLDRRSLAFYLLCGVLVTGLPSYLFYEVAPEIGPGKLAIIIALTPLMTYGGAILVGIDRAATLRLTGLALGLAAIVVAMLPRAIDHGGAGLIWMLAALLLPVIFSAGNLVLALGGPKGADPFALIGAFQIVGALLLLPVTLATHTFAMINHHWAADEWAALGMMVASSFGYSLFLHVLQHAGPVFAAQANYIVTAMGIAWGIVLFGETHSPWIWAALVIVMVGVALVKERTVKQS